ncbi:hypothetical protein BDY21DRAFT_123067 [Lineolata rhizophorae]|uniref:Basic leucine zipper transcriptional factor ATF-like n=1 Tax=Lineolata rhizophorae TaxID=578093 RepID=A0A6A6NPJ9_9PEZI|nr:hypothetical protein BDY21DRAFT_123067 [Lineolata rhizophorae]
MTFLGFEDNGPDSMLGISQSGAFAGSTSPELPTIAYDTDTLKPGGVNHERGQPILGGKEPHSYEKKHGQITPPNDLSPFSAANCSLPEGADGPQPPEPPPSKRKKSSGTASISDVSAPASQTDSTEDKRAKQLEKNRMAAWKSRQKKKRTTEELKNTKDELELENVRLKEDMKHYRNENNQLLNLLLQHISCGHEDINNYFKAKAARLTSQNNFYANLTINGPNPSLGRASECDDAAADEQVVMSDLFLQHHLSQCMSPQGAPAVGNYATDSPEDQLAQRQFYNVNGGEHVGRAKVSGDDASVTGSPSPKLEGGDITDDFLNI